MSTFELPHGCFACVPVVEEVSFLNVSLINKNISVSSTVVSEIFSLVASWIPTDVKNSQMNDLPFQYTSTLYHLF
jgi:hypothetical protein